MQELVEAKFSIGNVVKHKFLNFRGVIFDLDPSFNNTEEWYNSIPKDFRPKKDHPFIMFLQKMKKYFISLMSQSRILLMMLKVVLQIILILRKFFHTSMEMLTFRTI